MTDKKLRPNTGLRRIWKALGYSLAGLKTAFRHEAAFRQELVLFLILLPIIFYLPLTPVFKMLLLMVNSLVLIVELLNSAIEAGVDLASPGYHELAKRAKDLASAAVFASLLLAVIVWSTACYISLSDYV